MWCGYAWDRASYAPIRPRSRRWRWFRRWWVIGTDGLVDHPRLIDADEADVVAIGAVHGCDLRDAVPARAIILRHSLVCAFDCRRIGNDAAGIVTGDPRPRARRRGRSGKGGKRKLGRADQEQRRQRHGQPIPTHCRTPPASRWRSLEACGKFWKTAQPYPTPLARGRGNKVTSWNRRS